MNSCATLTSLSSKAWYSNKCALTWKEKGTPFKRLLYQLSPSTRRTAETESGLLRTPNMNERGTRSSEGMKKGHQVELQDQIRMLPTPKKNEANGIGVHGMGSQDLRTKLGTKTGLKLQPAFVEWMMGFPEGWTEIPDSKVLEMRSSRKSPQK